MPHAKGLSGHGEHDEGGPMNESVEGLSDLTDRERDLLAHLTVLTIQRQLKPARSYERISVALAEIAENGDVLLRGDDDDVYVLILGRVIVHAARDWLRWTAFQVERHGDRN
jgi:hypothetical protein